MSRTSCSQRLSTALVLAIVAESASGPGVWAQSASRSAATAQGISVAEAIQQAQQTGRPIFAVAGATYCPACRKLLSTLNTDSSLQPLIAQFVALKIDAQSSDYARWRQFFPPERAAIPALYIVTPRGQQLFSKVGALPSESLRSVMLTSLEKAGRYPTPEQWEEIAKTLDAVEQALQEDRVDQAIERLQPLLEGLVKLGPLTAYAEPGKRASALVEQVAARQVSALDEALQAFTTTNDLDTALRVATAEGLCGLFPHLQDQSQARVKQSLRTAAQRKLLRQARELQQAQTLAGEAASRRKGVAALQRLAKRYPNTDVALRARQQLQELGQLQSARGATVGRPLRRWSDVSGRFSVRARLLEVTGDRVRLRQADGKVVSIAIAELDEEGRRYVAQAQP